MGCDEHLYFEIRRPGEDRWAAVGPDPKLDAEGEWGNWEFARRGERQWMLGRYYEAYAVLCDVRASYMPDGMDSWFSFRGVPPGMDPCLRGRDSDEKLLGADHSITWFTAQELYDQFWTPDVPDRLVELRDKMVEVAQRHGVPLTDLRAVIGFDG